MTSIQGLFKIDRNKRYVVRIGHGRMKFRNLTEVSAYFNRLTEKKGRKDNNGRENRT